MAAVSTPQGHIAVPVILATNKFLRSKLVSVCRPHAIPINHSIGKMHTVYYITNVNELIE